ncbi:MAG: hypothetical protein WDN04_06535 [Rhodospirillales bacterium]
MAPAGPGPKLRLVLLAGIALATASSAWAQSSDSSNSGSSAGDGGLPAPPSLPPPSGSLLPPFGADPTSPALRDRLMDVLGLNEPAQVSSAAVGPAWQFKPQLTVSEEFTDNASASGGPPVGPTGNAGSDFITLIQPQLQILKHQRSGAGQHHLQSDRRDLC